MPIAKFEDYQFQTMKGSIVVEGKRFPFQGHTEWAGNWCWDAVGMELETLVAFLETLRELDFSCVAGEEVLFECYEKGRPQEKNHLMRLLEIYE